MTIKKIRLIMLFILLMFIVILSGCATKSVDAPIKNGVLDLTQESGQHTGVIPLEGAWQFYWQQFVTYDQLASRQPDLMVEVPNAWIFNQLDGKALEGTGYATYRLHVKTDEKAGHIMALKMSSFSSAYQLAINDQVVAVNGKIGQSKSEEKPAYRPMVAVFSIPASEFDVLIQVSNFNYAHGGFWNLAYIGTAEEVLAYHEYKTRYESTLLGALLVVSLFFLAMYLLNRKFKYALYFALTCLALGVLLDMVGEMSLIKMFGLENFNLTVWIWYSSILWFLGALNLYMHELFPTKYSRITLKFFGCYFIVVECVYTLTSPVFYGKLAFITNYFEIAWLANLLIIVCLGVWHKKRGSLLNLISILVAFISYTYDVLSFSNQVRFEMPQSKLYGILMFVFIQMTIQAGRIKSDQEEILTSELAFLHSQIKPHFLYNALNAIISVSRVDSDKARELLVEFSQYLRRSFDFKDFSHFTFLKNEIEQVKSYVEIEKARFEERINVCFEVPEYQEYQVPVLILQPIIENAINHGILTKAEGGKVDVKIQVNAQSLDFTVQDNGGGFDVSNISAKASEEVRKGIGLTNIDSRLKKMYGKGLKIESQKDLGTIVSWSIPLDKKELRK